MERDMDKNTQNDYLLKAIGAFNRRFMVISPEYKILASSSSGNTATKYYTTVPCPVLIVP